VTLAVLSRKLISTVKRAPKGLMRIEKDFHSACEIQ
jgi:hypothetical protein